MIVLMESALPCAIYMAYLVKAQISAVHLVKRADEGYNSYLNFQAHEEDDGAYGSSSNLNQWDQNAVYPNQWSNIQYDQYGNPTNPQWNQDIDNLANMTGSMNLQPIQTGAYEYHGQEEPSGSQTSRVVRPQAQAEASGSSTSRLGRAARAMRNAATGGSSSSNSSRNRGNRGSGDGSAQDASLPLQDLPPGPIQDRARFLAVQQKLLAEFRNMRNFKYYQYEFEFAQRTMLRGMDQEPLELNAWQILLAQDKRIALAVREDYLNRALEPWREIALYFIKEMQQNQDQAGHPNIQYGYCKSYLAMYHGTRINSRRYRAMINAQETDDTLAEALAHFERVQNIRWESLGLEGRE